MLESRIRLNHISYQQEGFEVIANLELDWRGDTFYGVSQEADTAKGRMVAAGRAALNALGKVTDQRAAFFLDGLHTFRIFERNVTVATVRVVSDLLRTSLVGCATVVEDPNYAAAQAVLGAVNRSFSRLIVPLRRQRPAATEPRAQLPAYRDAAHEEMSQEDRLALSLPPLDRD
ncbi:MAG TPA: hypothetical protein VIC59_08420 [Gemmatimonadota bacterium]|jgi:hypothetical protein